VPALRGAGRLLCWHGIYLLCRPRWRVSAAGALLVVA
jgi:hypothetical protein